MIALLAAVLLAPAFAAEPLETRDAVLQDAPIVLSGHGREVKVARYSPDGDRVLTASLDFTARLWDAGTGRELDAFNIHSWIESAAYEPDGKRIVVAGMATVQVLDAKTLRPLQVIDQHARTAALSPDGSRVATGGWQEAVLWDAATGERGCTIVHAGSVVSVAFSPDGSMVLAGQGDGTVGLWTMRCGKLRWFKIRDERLYGAAFSPDGALVATAGSAGTIQLWDAATGAELRALEGHEKAVTSVAFSSDGRKLVSASEDGTARVWDIATAEATDVLKHEAPVASASFSPDGVRVVTASGDVARVWRLGYTAAERSAIARQLSGRVLSDPSAGLAKDRFRIDFE